MYVRVAGLPSIVIAVREIVSEEIGIEHGRKERVNGYGGRSKPTRAVADSLTVRSVPRCGGHKRQSVI